MIKIDQLYGWWFLILAMHRWFILVDHRGPLPGGRCRLWCTYRPQMSFHRREDGLPWPMRFRSCNLDVGSETYNWKMGTWGNPRLREVYSAPLCWISDLAHSMFGMRIWYIKIRVLPYISICFPHVCQDRVTGNISQPGQVSLSSSWVARCRKMSIHGFQPVWQCSTPQMSTTQVPHSVWRKVPLSVAQMWGAWDTLVAVVGQCTVSMICAGIRLYPESFMNVSCKRHICHTCQTFRWWYINLS